MTFPLAIATQPNPNPRAPEPPRAPRGDGVSVTLLAPFIEVAAALELPVAAALANAELTAANLDDRELRVSHAQIERMLQGAAAIGGARSLGLLAAERIGPHQLDVVEYAARVQPTLRAAFKLAARFYPLLHDSFRAELRASNESEMLRIEPTQHGHDETVVEFALAAHLMVARRVTGVATLAPLAVHFVHARPANVAVHRRIFGDVVQFGRGENALVFSRSVLDTPLPAADAGLAALLERYGMEATRKLGRSGGVIEHMRELVQQDLASGKLPSADQIARRLGMSARTLHRRLSGLGATYHGVVEDVQREVALRCLRDPRLSLRDVGRLLGFTTSPAFHRAFRRWTGTTAGAFRSELTKWGE
jgi:AraC-like DNA-binding protein